MSKKLFGIILFLSLSLFLVMPVNAAEPPQFTKNIDVYPGDLDYRNTLVDWNGYNIDIVLYWNKQGGLLPDTLGFLCVLSGTTIINKSTSSWVDIGDSIFQLNLNTTEKNQIKGIMFSRQEIDNSFCYFSSRTIDFDPFLLEIRLEFNSLLNIDFNSIYVKDFLRQARTGLLSGFAKTLDLVGQENTIGGGKADFIIKRFTLDNETTQPITTGVVTPIIQRANYNFINKYTGVKKIYYNVVISANAYDPADSFMQYGIYQLGFFATTQTILPDLDVDTDFQIYEPTICGAFDLGCVSRNLIGEFSNNIYKRLGAENIASGIMNIYDTLFYPVYIVDAAAWQNGIISIYAIIGIGVLYLIVKRVLS